MSESPPFDDASARDDDTSAPEPDVVAGRLDADSLGDDVVSAEPFGAETAVTDAPDGPSDARAVAAYL